MIANAISRAEHEIEPRFSPIKLANKPPAMSRTGNNGSIYVKYLNAAVMLPLLAAIAAGCTTTRTGDGSSPSGASPVTFRWKSSDAVSGIMNATLPDGATYSGRYFRITRDTTVDSIAPLWAGWHSGWRGEGDWDSGPTADFITNYTGRVVANLATPTATHMRCHFKLMHPSKGMAGGGSGECQLPDGKAIDARFPIA